MGLRRWAFVCQVRTSALAQSATRIMSGRVYTQAALMYIYVPAVGYIYLCMYGEDSNSVERIVSAKPSGGLVTKVKSRL